MVIVTLLLTSTKVSQVNNIQFLYLSFSLKNPNHFIKLLIVNVLRGSDAKLLLR